MPFGQIWRKQKLFTISMMVVTLAAAVVFTSLVTQGVRAAAQNKMVAPDATPLVIPPAEKLSNQFTELAKKVETSVVFVQTEINPKPQQSVRRQSPRRGQPDSGEEEDDPQADLFRRFFGQMPNMMPELPRRRSGQGSGFVVDRNGYIITNLHVVDGADRIQVSFPSDKSGETYKAKTIGFDTESDIAVIKIDAGHALTPLKVANSDGVQVGDWAVAIGAPFGLEATFTAGIVSATGRDLPGNQQFQHFIQTDAAINPGNSGGPLVNINGEAIGVNTQIATHTGGYEGIGFALPINMAVRAYNDIIEYGMPRRGSIGVSFPKQAKPELMEAYGYKGGVVVSEVTKGGPGDKAGIKPDDLIVAMNGKPITDGDDLVNRIANTPVGNSVDLTIDRNGTKMDKKVAVQDRIEVYKDDRRFAAYHPQVTDSDSETSPISSAKFGIGLAPVSDETRKAYNIEGTAGMRVTTVEEGSFAEDIGLQEKDIIVSINRKPVATLDDVKAIQGKLKVGDPVAFKVVRPIPQQFRQRPDSPTFATFYAAGRLPKSM